MTKLSRRTFLSGAATAGVAAAAGTAAATVSSSAAKAATVPVIRSSERVVVIGSGFGGGVTALRLAQAGVKVLVLERGKWWRPNGPNTETFPHAAVLDKRDLFYTIWPEAGGQRLGLQPYVGLLEMCSGQNITAIVAAGVGGGSLVYQGMTLQPTEAVFGTWFPSGIDYAEMNSVFYPRVAKMLQVETAPDALINSPNYKTSRVFAQRVQAAGYPLAKVPMPIDWNFALQELQGKMKPSYTNGDCALGVNNGGKHSVDLTYLAQAIATGNTTVATLHNVTDVAQNADGTWQVSVDVTDETGTLKQQKIITTKALVMAAGTINTSRLLVRAAARGQIKDLPDGLGQGFGTNGDQIYVWTDSAANFGVPQGGPVVYGSFEWDDPNNANTVIQASIPPVSLNFSAYEWLLPGAAGIAKNLLLNLQSTMLVGYGVSKDRGQFTYNATKGTVDLSWPSGGDAAIAARIKQRITTVGGPKATLTLTNQYVNTTWHSLGGACMGTVCDLEGRVQGKKGLYVLDGALMPGTTGACNPSMTIAAIAERALDRIVKNDVGTII